MCKKHYKLQRKQYILHVSYKIIIIYFDMCKSLEVIKGVSEGF